MSARTDRVSRRGAVLLLAMVVASVLALCVAALWRTAARAHRMSALDAGIGAAAIAADSAALAALWSVDSGVWRRLAQPGDTLTIVRRVLPRGWSTSELARIGWGSLLIRGTGAMRSGVPQVLSAAEKRIVIPLVPPVPMPAGPLTGGTGWLVDPGAAVVFSPVTSAESRCRPTSVAVAAVIHPFPAGFDAGRFTQLDPDTVTDSLTGAFRLTRGVLSRPLGVTGMVVTDSALLVGADLRVTGMLVVRGSIRPGGGQLDVTGAVVAGDAGGGNSGLGPADRVRYDACAIRRAMERMTRPGAPATWTHLRLF